MMMKNSAFVFRNKQPLTLLRRGGRRWRFVKTLDARRMLYVTLIRYRCNSVEDSPISKHLNGIQLLVY